MDKPLELIDDGEEGLHLRRGQGGCGLVQNQHLAVRGDGLGNLHQLHLGHAEAAQLGPGIEVQVNLLQHRRRVCIHFLVVNGDNGPQASGGVAAHIDVLADAALGDGLELLVHHGDATVEGVQRALDLDLLPLVNHLALVHVIDAEHALHQRGLSGAVLSHQRVNGAGAEIELRVVQRLDAGEGFNNSTHFQTIL